MPFSDDEIAQTTDWPKVQKYYKLNGAPALGNNAKDEQARRDESEMLILGAMALRGV